MPELPEVETIVRGLRRDLLGARVTRVWTSGLPLRLARPLDEKRLVGVSEGKVIGGLTRRGKYMLLGFGRAGGVVIHLGMSGRLRLQPAEVPRERHTHVVWTLAGKGARELRFVDPRRFGFVQPAETFENVPELASLGPDPLSELDEEALAEALAGSRAPLKSFLLDQRRIAGLGNIYVSEALFRARLHPGLPAHRARGKAGVLLEAIRGALELGIRNRGTTLRDYVDAAGGSGSNQQALLVYGRDGEPCPSCAAPIRRRVDSARSTFFCARCQRR